MDNNQATGVLDINTHINALQAEVDCTTLLRREAIDKLRSVISGMTVEPDNLGAAALQARLSAFSIYDGMLNSQAGDRERVVKAVTKAKAEDTNAKNGEVIAALLTKIGPSVMTTNHVRESVPADADEQIEKRLAAGGVNITDDMLTPTGVEARLPDDIRELVGK